MDLKCIGGECDGQIQYVDDRIGIGDQVKVSLPTELKISDGDFLEGLNAYREGRTPDSMTVKYYLYRICTIHGIGIRGDKLTLMYLCPHDWHEWQAIKYQFMK